MASISADMIDRYARGLLTIAEAEGAVDRVSDELYQFGRALQSNNELREALADRTLPAERRLGVVDDLLDDRADPQTVAAVAHVIQSGRGRHLVDIIDAFVKASAERGDRSVAEVRTAVELSDEQRERLRAGLRQAIGRDVELKVIVDESIVGGVLARVGDTVIDGSVARQLSRLRAQMAGV